MSFKMIEVEIGDVHNHSFWFPPISKLIRGSFDFNRHPEPLAKVEASKWPGPIPGQRLGIEPDGTGFIKEPLHDEVNAELRKRIEATGVSLAPALQTFDDVDLPSWLFYIKLAVEVGVAKVVRGSLPDEIEGKVRHDYVLNEAEATPMDRLTAATERQSELMAKLLERLAK